MMRSSIPLGLVLLIAGLGPFVSATPVVDCVPLTSMQGVDPGLDPGSAATCVVADAQSLVDGNQISCAYGLVHDTLQFTWEWGVGVAGHYIPYWPAVPSWPLAHYCAETNNAGFYAETSDGRYADELANMECVYGMQISSTFSKHSLATGEFAGIHLPLGTCHLRLDERPFPYPEGSFSCVWSGGFDYDLTLSAQAQRAFGDLLGVPPESVLTLFGDGDLPGSCIGWEKTGGA